MPKPPELRPETDRQLNRRGVAAVTATLANSGPGQNAEFPLHPQGIPNPDRAYIESWLSRKKNEERARATARYEEAAVRPAQGLTFWMLVIAAVILVVTFAGLIVGLTE